MKGDSRLLKVTSVAFTVGGLASSTKGIPVPTRSVSNPYSLNPDLDPAKDLNPYPDSEDL